MKQRIVALFLLLALAVACLSGCAYNYSNHSYNVDGLNKQAFWNELTNLTIAGGDFSDDEATRQEKVADAVRATMVKFAQEDSSKKKTTGKVSVDDALAFCYYRVHNGDDAYVLVDKMSSSSAEVMGLKLDKEGAEATFLGELTKAVKDFDFGDIGDANRAYQTTSISEDKSKIAYVTYTERKFSDADGQEVWTENKVTDLKPVHLIKEANKDKEEYAGLYNQLGAVILEYISSVGSTVTPDTFNKKADEAYTAWKNAADADKAAKRADLDAAVKYENITVWFVTPGELGEGVSFTWTVEAKDADVSVGKDTTGTQKVIPAGKSEEFTYFVYPVAYYKVDTFNKEGEGVAKTAKFLFESVYGKDITATSLEIFGNEDFKGKYQKAGEDVDATLKEMIEALVKAYADIKSVDADLEANLKVLNEKTAVHTAELNEMNQKVSDLSYRWNYLSPILEEDLAVAQAKAKDQLALANKEVTTQQATVNSSTATTEQKNTAKDKIATLGKIIDLYQAVVDATADTLKTAEDALNAEYATVGDEKARATSDLLTLSTKEEITSSDVSEIKDNITAAQGFKNALDADPDNTELQGKYNEAVDKLVTPATKAAVEADPSDENKAKRQAEIDTAFASPSYYPYVLKANALIAATDNETIKTNLNAVIVAAETCIATEKKQNENKAQKDSIIAAICDPAAVKDADGKSAAEAIVNAYWDDQYDTLKADYESTVAEQIEKAVADVMKKYLPLDKIHAPAGAVQDAYKTDLTYYKNQYYAGSTSQAATDANGKATTVSVPNTELYSTFKAYVLDQFEGANTTSYKKIVRAEAEQEVKEIVRVYILAEMIKDSLKDQASDIKAAYNAAQDAYYAVQDKETAAEKKLGEAKLTLEKLTAKKKDTTEAQAKVDALQAEIDGYNEELEPLEEELNKTYTLYSATQGFPVSRAQLQNVAYNQYFMDAIYGRVSYSAQIAQDYNAMIEIYGEQNLTTAIVLSSVMNFFTTGEDNDANVKVYSHVNLTVKAD